MSAHDADSARGLSVPPCAKCESSDRVRAVYVSGVDPAVQYWSCEACGLVWATRDERKLRPIAADSPRKRA